jgi:hypothetical protein
LSTENDFGLPKIFGRTKHREMSKTFMSKQWSLSC